MVNDQITINLRTEGVQKVSNDLNKVSKSVKGFSDNFRQLEEQARKAGGVFRGELLSLLFFGAAIQRIFKNITFSSAKFFQEVTEGQTMAGQALTRLTAAWQFLKFTIGDAIATALLPLIPAIVDVVALIADWIERNPKLTAGILGLGLVIGTLFTAVGGLGLGLSGVAQTFRILIVPLFEAIAGFLGFEAAAVSAGASVAALYGAIALLVLIIIRAIPRAWEAFNQLSDNLGIVVKNIIGLIQDLFLGNMDDAGIRLKIILLGWVQHFALMAKLIVSIILGLNEAIVGVIGAAIYALAKAIDAVINAMGGSSSLAETVRQNVADATNAIRNLPPATFFNDITGSLASQIAGLQAQLSTETGGATGENVTINGDINITGDVDYEALLEELRRRSGGTRTSNL